MTNPSTIQKQINQLDQQIESLKNTPPAGKAVQIQQTINLIQNILQRDNGFQEIYKKSPALVEAGLFHKKPWKDPTKLVPALVSGTLLADHPTSTFEIVSNLRMLAYATGKGEHDNCSKEEAMDYMEQVIVHNLNYCFHEPSKKNEQHQNAYKLIQLLMEKVPFEGMKDKFAEEVKKITAQRPIITQRVKDILHLAKERLELHPEQNKDDKILSQYLDILECPTSQCSKNERLSDYRSFLKEANKDELEAEAKQFAKNMNKTGLVSPYHAVFVQDIADIEPGLLKKSLGLDATGKAEFNEHIKLIQELINTAISPATPQAVYGLAKSIERGVFSGTPAQNAISKLLSMDIHPEVSEQIVKSDLAEGKVNPKQILIGGVLCVLGQPIGIGQGHNPTCQSARGISLWSEQSPAKLLNMVYIASKCNDLEYHFEGEVLRSSQLPSGITLTRELYTNLDPISIVLVPHLDKIYNQMMRKANYRGEDGHKWVNPAFYGYWIPTGFMSAFDQYSQAVTNYETFIRTFYASQHPEYNGGFQIVFPNPLGIIITTPYNDFAGFHAVSLLRVQQSPQGEWRAYFLNPQNEGRVNWGQSIQPSVEGHGERHGESSLPFHQFASRIYAFHYNTLELGDIEKVKQSEVNKVTKLAKESWGKSYQWK